MKRRSFLHFTTASALSAHLPLQSSPEIIVVGAGAFGGWTAFYLREMGARVTLLDAYGPGNARASSGGETRLIRADYGADERVTNPYQLKRTRDYIGWQFPALREQPVIESRVCQTEVSVDDNFIVQPHPDLKNVWIAGGGSGHGFKHGPAFGQYLANRLLGRGGDQEFDQAFTLKKETF